MREGELQAWAVEVAHRLGWAVARFPAQNYRTARGRNFAAPLAHDTKGYPDATFVRERLVVVEFKAARGKLSFDQAVWLRRLRAAGVEAYVARPSDIASLEMRFRARSEIEADAAVAGLDWLTGLEVDREIGKAAA